MMVMMAEMVMLDVGLNPNPGHINNHSLTIQDTYAQQAASGLGSASS